MYENELHRACAKGNLKRVKKLLEMGININKETKKCKVTPLHSACIAGQYETVKYLILAGANMRSVAIIPHWTPEYFAQVQGHALIVNLIRIAQSLVDKDIKRDDIFFICALNAFKDGMSGKSEEGH